MALMTFAIGGISYWMPEYISKFRNAGSLAHVNTIFGMIVLASGLTATMLGGWVSDKLAERYQGAYFWISGIGILVSCPFVLMMLKLPFPYAWGAIAAAVFFLFFNTGPSNTILANVTRPTIRHCLCGEHLPDPRAGERRTAEIVQCVSHAAEHRRRHPASPP